jgi:hypothetical protein
MRSQFSDQTSSLPTFDVPSTRSVAHTSYFLDLSLLCYSTAAAIAIHGKWIIHKRRGILLPRQEPPPDAEIPDFSVEPFRERVFTLTMYLEFFQGLLCFFKAFVDSAVISVSLALAVLCGLRFVFGLFRSTSLL